MATTDPSTITFVEDKPTIEPFRGIGFLLTIEGRRFLLPLNGLYRLHLQCRAAEAKGIVADMEADERIIPFPNKRRRRRG